MKNDNFYKTLRIVCLILAIVCMALSLVKKAKAEDFNTSDLKQFYIDYLKVFGDQIDSNFDYDTAFLPFTNGDLPFSFMLVDPHGNCSVVLCKYDDPVIKSNTSSVVQSNSWGFFMQTKGGSSSYPYDFCGYKSNHNISWSTLIFRVISVQYYGFGTASFTCSDFKCDWNEAKTNYYATHTYINSVTGFNTIGSTVISSTFYPGQLFIPDDAIYYGVDSGSAGAFGNYEPYLIEHNWNNVNNISIISSNTDGFEVYKYGTSGSERLVCDFADCISISNAVGNTSTIQINITINGIDQTFNFDSSSIYYDYSVPNHIAKYSFPLSIFGINNETISAKLSGVKIVNTTSSPGGSGTKDLIWVTPLTLIGSDYEDLEPEVIPDAPDYTLNVNNQQYYDDIENKIYSEWVEDVTQSDVHNYVDGNTLICAYQRGYTWADWWNDWSGFFANVQDLPTYIFDNSPSSTDEFKTKMMDFLKNNYGSLYFDTVIITWDPRNGELPLIYVWKTNLYQLKNTNNILKDMAEDLNISAFYTKQTYFDIKGRLDDFEDKSLTKLNEMVGLQELENGFISSLQSILNQILNALLNLNIDIPEADYTDILAKLDTIIDNQDTSDINDDWYQNYREWLYGINENDSYLSPHEYFNNIFGTLKTTFDSFTNNISFNAYLLKIEDFINHISGTTTDNLTIYLRDGIGDPGFNINNNYMYTVGGSQ